MSIESKITQVIIESSHMGFLLVQRKTENEETWLEIGNEGDYPLVIQTEKDIDKLIDELRMLKTLLK